MTFPYTAIIEGTPRTITSMDADGKYLLDKNEVFCAQSLASGEVKRSSKLVRIAKLTYTGGVWLLDGKSLVSQYFDAVTNRHENSGETRTSEWTTFTLLEILQPFLEKDPKAVRGVAWFDDDYEKVDEEAVEDSALRQEILDSIPGCEKRELKPPLPAAKNFKPVLLSDFWITNRQYESAGQHANSIITAVNQLEKVADAVVDRFEAVGTQLESRTVALKETIAPLNRLYSEVELAEIRKRAIGKQMPDIFVDWVLTQFKASNPVRLPTKGEAFNACGNGTIIGKKLAAASKGVSKQRFGAHLTVIRRLLEEKGWLASQLPGTTRKRATGYDPGDDQQEDINQINPAESAADKDDWAHIPDKDSSNP